MKTLPIYWRHAKTVLRKQGAVALIKLIKRRLFRLSGNYTQGYYDFGYQTWRHQHITQGRHTPPGKAMPTVSIVVPVYNVGEKWLKATLRSVVDQTYPHWQLCLVNDNATLAHIRPMLDRCANNDSRILVHHNTKNLGIAESSNIGLKMATGEFIALLDHDDVLSPDALSVFNHWLDRFPDAGLFYSDEDKVNTLGQFSQPFFKPDFSPELLYSQNYIGHLVIIATSLIRDIGGFRPGFDGAQDYDLLLRATHAASQVVHIPQVLYHWRQIPGSTAMHFGEKDYAWDAGKRALEDFYRERNGHSGVQAIIHKGDVPGTYVNQLPVDSASAVSILIPFRDQPALLHQCLQSILANNDWNNLEILGIDNQSVDPEIPRLKAQWRETDPRIRFIDYDQDFNFSAICNAGVEQTKGDYLVLLNNDVEITATRWIETLLQYASQAEIGAVGGLLRYPDQSIQHAGIVLGIGGSAGHPFKTFASDQIGYFGRLKVTSNVSAVTGALMMVKKSRYLEVSGFDEDNFAIAFNDVDFCLKLQELNYRNVITPSCHGIHHESASRGYERTPTQRRRFETEERRFVKKWRNVITQGDPFYNPNLTVDSEDYTLKGKQ